MSLENEQSRTLRNTFSLYLDPVALTRNEVVAIVSSSMTIPSRRKDTFTAMKDNAVLIRDEQSLFEYLSKIFKEVFDRGDKVAVKLHMGEPGNRYFIKPAFTQRLCELLGEAGIEPFVFDTPVVYNSPRNNEQSYLKSAAANGYDEESIGAPIVISNRSVEAKGTLMTYRIAKEVLDADGVLLLTHVKGHIACGMGGAVKNIGMGCMAKETKGEIHTGGEPRYDEGCVQCGICVENCPTENIVIENERPVFGRTWCSGCSNCAIVCPEECIKPKNALFDKLLAEAAALAHERFEKVYAVNVLKNISKLCDCVADSGPIIVDDIGYICAADMISADAASLEVIRRATGKDDIFSEYNLRSSWDHVREAAAFLGREAETFIEELPERERD